MSLECGQTYIFIRASQTSSQALTWAWAGAEGSPTSEQRLLTFLAAGPIPGGC